MSNFPNPNTRVRGRIPVLRRGTRRNMGQQRRLPTQTSSNNSLSSRKLNAEAPTFVFQLTTTPQPEAKPKKLNPLASAFDPSVFNFGASPSSRQEQQPTQLTSVAEYDSSSSSDYCGGSETSDSERSDFSADDNDQEQNEEDDEGFLLSRDYSTGCLAARIVRYSIADLMEIRETVEGDVPTIANATNLLCNPIIVAEAITAALEMKPQDVKRFAFAAKGSRDFGYSYTQPKKYTRARLSEKSQNPFHQQQKRRVSASELEKLMRKTKGILNKIVPKEGQSFDRLSQRLCDLIKENVHCNEEMEVVLDAVVTVAAGQPKFARRYVELLSSLSSKEEIVQSWESAHANVTSQQRERDVEANREIVVKRTVRSLCHRYHDRYWFATNQDQHAKVVLECGERLGVAVDGDICSVIAEFAVPSENDDESAPARRNLFGLETLIGELCLGNLLPRTLVICKVMKPLLHVDEGSASPLSEKISPIDEYIGRNEKQFTVNAKSDEIYGDGFV